MLAEHIYGNHKNALFVTLTIDEEHYDDDPEGLIPQYMRIFWENYRTAFVSYKDRSRIPTHWFATERGEKKGRLHLHGIIWDSEFFIPESAYHSSQLIHKPGCMNVRESEIAHSIGICWPFGSQIFVGSSCSVKTMSYITKYISKECKYDNTFYSRVYCSPGIGRCELKNSAVLSNIRRDCNSFVVPKVSSSSRLVPAPRYYVSCCFDPSEYRLLSDRRLARSRDPNIPFEKYLRGIKFTNEQLYEDYRKRLLADDRRFGLYNERKSVPDYSYYSWHRLISSTAGTGF